MAYLCSECGYRAKRFPGGVCPACGNPDIKPVDSKLSDQVKARSPFRLAFCLALWLFLLVEIYKALS